MQINQKTPTTNTNNRIEKAVAVATALLVWQFISMLLNQRILLASPLDVAKALAELIPSTDFLKTVWFSFSRIAAGFFLGLAVGCICAACSARFHIAEVLLWPYMAVIKATPVASFIILSLVWLTPRKLSVFISFLIVLPVIYTNLLAGLKSRKPELAEMAKLYEIPIAKRFLAIDLPQLRPYLLSALELSLGMAWKAGVAAEVIGTPAGSIGKMLYNAKIYLATPELFAWSIVVVVVSVVFEKAVTGVCKIIFGKLERLLWILK
ncbi:MAG: ABC transporter permease subunit [Blautia sp.]|nr:ABC transporter permease subunit [Blautia sp.]